MPDRTGVMAAALIAITVLRAPVALAQPAAYDFTVDVTSGPLSGSRHLGIVSVDFADWLQDNPDTIKPTAISFTFGDIEFTETDDVRDDDANSPRANFQAGTFLGTTYIVSRFGNNPTQLPSIDDTVVDGFVIDNHDFGYAVGANLYQGFVNYHLPPEAAQLEAQAVPEPSLWIGLTVAGCGYWLACRPH